MAMQESDTRTTFVVFSKHSGFLMEVDIFSHFFLVLTIDISYILDGASHTVGRRTLKPGRRRWSFPVDMEHDNSCILYCGNGQS